MWQTLIINGYWVQAKVYEVGSHFGINDGRISKLCICKGERYDSNKIAVNYDRGWDIRPQTPEAQTVLDDVLLRFA